MSLLRPGVIKQHRPTNQPTHVLLTLRFWICSLDHCLSPTCMSHFLRTSEYANSISAILLFSTCTQLLDMLTWSLPLPCPSCTKLPNMLTRSLFPSHVPLASYMYFQIYSLISAFFSCPSGSQLGNMLTWSLPLPCSFCIQLVNRLTRSVSLWPPTSKVITFLSFFLVFLSPKF